MALINRLSRLERKRGLAGYATATKFDEDSAAAIKESVRRHVLADETASAILDEFAKLIAPEEIAVSDPVNIGLNFIRMGRQDTAEQMDWECKIVQSAAAGHVEADVCGKILADLQMKYKTLLDEVKPDDS